MRVLLLLLVGCASAPIIIADSPSTTEPTGPSTTESTGPSTTGPATGPTATGPTTDLATSETTPPTEPPTVSEPAAAPPCDVRIDTNVSAQPDGTFVVRASLTSLVGPLEVTVPDACPNGAATFRGLPEPYDYYRTCNAGACPTTSPRRVALGDSPTVIAEAAVDPRPSTCNAAVPSGLYLISAELSLPNVRLCANRAATLTVR